MIERFRQGSIRAQIVTLVAAVALPLLGLGAYNVYAEYRLSSSRAEQSATELAEATAAAVTQFLDDGERILEGLARHPGVREMDPAVCDSRLSELNEVLPQFANIVMADADGRLVCSAVPPTTEVPSAGSDYWFETVRGNRAFTVGRPRLGRITGAWIVVLALPILDDDDRFLGALGVSVALERFQELLARLTQPPDAVVTIADEDWTVLARSREWERWVGQTLPGERVPETPVAPGVGVLESVGLDGIDRVFGFVNIPAADWRVYAGVPKWWIYAPVQEAALRRVAAGLLVLAFVVTLAASLYRQIARALGGLVEATRAAARRSGARLPVEGPLEVSQVARQFNRTLAARDRAEQELHQARERYRSVMQNAVVGILVCDLDGTFHEVNPALVRMLGFDSAKDLLATPVPELFQDPARFEELRDSYLSGTPPGAVELSWRRRDGTRITVRLSGTAVSDAQGRTALEVVAEDVTELRILEEQIRHTQKLEAVGLLAGGVAHDFNNLLTVVGGQAHLVLDELAQGDPRRSGIHAIIEASDRGARLTGQLLAFSRKQVVLPRMLDPNVLIHGLESLFGRVLGEDVEVRTELSAGLGSILADAGQMEQVLLNLVLNARDAMPDGGRIVIRTENRDLDEEFCRTRVGVRPGRYVLLSVSDTGHGIAPEVREHLFEPFFTTKPEGKGTGLGLSTVYGIVTQAGGHVEARPDGTGGATFDVYLPRLRRSAQAEVERGPEASPAGAGSSGTVLVVEDEPAVRDMVCGTLRRGGYRVLAAADGQEGLAMAAAHPDRIDLLVTDVVMPAMKGPELAERLVPLRPGLRVLFMSGYAENPPVDTRFGGSPSSFLAKPFAPAELLREVHELLGDGVAVPERP